MAVDYRVAVALAMTSNHNAILGALSAHLLGVNTKVNALTGGFNRLKLAIGGALSVTAGVAILETMTKLVEKTKDYSDELVKLERMGGDMAKSVISGDITKRAFDISQRVPMKVTDLMKIPGALYSIMGQEEAMKIWEPVAKFATVLQSDKNYKGDPGKDIQDLIRAGELSGRITDPATGQVDADKTNKFLDLAARIMAATHNMVNPQTMLGMAKQGGFTLRGLSDEGFMSMAMMAQAMGGPRAGTAYMSMWQQMAGGTMFTRTAEGMQDVGLLKSDEWRTDHGRVILDKAASQRLTKLIGKDPLDLAANLVEHFKNAGVTDPMEQMRLTMRALGRQTTQRFTAEEVTNFHQMLSERQRMAGGLGSEGAFGVLMNKSVGANLEAVKNAWDNLLMAIAGPNSSQVIQILQTLTSAFNYLQSNIRAMDPETLSSIAKGIGLLGLALSVGGTTAILLAIGPGGWLLGGLAALAVALTDKRFQEWLKGDSVSQWLNNAILAPIQRWMASDSLSRAFSGLAEKLYAGIKSQIDKLLGMFSGGLSPSDKGAIDKSHDGEGGVWRQRFDPGTSKSKPPTISLALNVDGMALARAVSQKQEALYRYETNPTDFNGSGSFA